MSKLKSETIVKVKNPFIINQLGGSTMVNAIVSVKIDKSIFDYETGINYYGTLTNDNDIQLATECGITKYKPNNYKDNESLYKKVLDAFNSYNPKKVYFSQFDIV